ncbi:MAG: hypothetical protein U9N79_07960 [Actinomycetota bacterium]|nr:hypothetical protein [Actinomycetota bacterium]
MSKLDPKHGRWILPVVVAALIGFTYLFVTALPPAEIPVGTTTTAAGSDTTTSVPDETTTTTLPADIAAFLRLADEYEATAKSIANDIDDANTAWENREGDVPSFVDTRDAFGAAKVEAQSLSESVAATSPPDAYSTVWPDTVTAAATLPPGIDAILEGLAAPDDGTARREAVDAYETLTEEFIATLDVVRAATP